MYIYIYDFFMGQNLTTAVVLFGKKPTRLLSTMHQVRWEEEGQSSRHSLCDDLRQEMLLQKIMVVQSWSAGIFCSSHLKKFIVGSFNGYKKFRCQQYTAILLSCCHFGKSVSTPKKHMLKAEGLAMLPVSIASDAWWPVAMIVVLVCFFMFFPGCFGFNPVLGLKQRIQPHWRVVKE